MSLLVHAGLSWHPPQITKKKNRLLRLIVNVASSLRSNSRCVILFLYFTTSYLKIQETFETSFLPNINRISEIKMFSLILHVSKRIVVIIFYLTHFSRNPALICACNRIYLHSTSNLSILVVIFKKKNILSL